VDGAVNIAPSLYAGIETSFVECDVLEFGAHHAPDDDLYLLRDTWNHAPKKSGEAPSFAGFLYASAGLAMLLVACDKGKARLVALRGYSTHGSSPGRSSWSAR